MSKNFIFAVGLLFVFKTFVMPQKQAENSNGEIMSLVNEERKFAKTAAEIGVNDSFLEFFAPDGINFQPQPVIVSQGKKEAKTGEQPKIIFSWEPIYADIARSGDLGYTTGPCVIMENTAERKGLRGGFYFSVWRKQADGTWKVLLDMGVGTPPTSSIDRKLTLAPQVKQNEKKAKPEKLIDEINQTERQFSALSEQQAIKAYEQFAREDMRLHRFRMLPVLGKESVVRHVSEKEMKSSWETIKSGVSASGDFAWSYGNYKLMQANSADDDDKNKGYYLRVWRRDDKNKWKIVAEVTNPLKL